MYNLFIDSREQRKLSFSEEYIDNVVNCKLDFGDYAAKIGEHRIPVVFERKSLTDLLGTLTNGHERFKNEINRATCSNIRLVIIVEKTFSDIIKGSKHSKVSGLSIIRIMFTIMIKYGVPFVCCKNREEMSKYISEFYYSYSKEYLKNNK